MARFALSPAEARVVTLIAEGQDQHEAASALHLSVHTVHEHLKHAYAKMGVHNRVQLVRRILEIPAKMP